MVLPAAIKSYLIVDLVLHYTMVGSCIMVPLNFNFIATITVLRRHSVVIAQATTDMSTDSIIIALLD